MASAPAVACPQLATPVPLRHFMSDPSSNSSRVILRTLRLVLREVVAEDLDFFSQLRGDSEVMRYYPRLFTREECAVWIERQLQRYRDDGHGFWLAQDAASGEPVGTVGVVLQEVEGERLLEVGYMLATRWWRRGLASEAARSCRDWAFVNLHSDAVHSLIRPVNIPSQGVARKNGMRPVRQVIFHELLHDLWQITREEWDRPPEERGSSSTVPPPA